MHLLSSSMEEVVRQLEVVTRGGTAQAWVYSLTPRDAENTSNVVTGATHSFVSRGFSRVCGVEAHLVEVELGVVMLTRSIIMCNKVVRDHPVEIQGRRLPAILIVLEMQRFDIILGMDWLASSYASIDCQKKEAVFRPLGEQEFNFIRSCVRSAPQILSAMQAIRLLLDGFPGYLACVKAVPKEGLKLEDIPVIREFSNVLPEDLPRLPRDREVEFAIELAPGTTPISKVPY
ncbi:uncharacterized protein LOC131143889 [Malania oleifera]|uniref:uncharacterized protein LOC131143889 n=1 Tax=Malania oleifera TaxID=397392 RepID=UPI0025AE511A|nr:uncharacterized protein LOC131143889 [Malania oleifera]